jgi:predicted amidohydrolase YtcJ
MINRDGPSLQCFSASAPVFNLLLVFMVLLAACDKPEPPVEARPEAKPAAVQPGVTLVHSGLVYTLDPASTVVKDGALAISADGAILAVGNTDAILAAYPDAEQHDLQGRAVFPGLIDAHAHFLGLAGSLTRANLVDTASTGEVIARLREFETTLGEGDWLVGRGWDQNDWPGQQFPSKVDLDSAFPDRPVWLERIDGHAGWANSAALAALDKVLSGDWQPQGGKIHRDEEGQATGIFIDGAMPMLDALVPPVSDERMQAAIDQATELLLSLGLTGVHDAGLDWASIQLLKQRADQGRLGVRVYAMTNGVGEALEQLCANGYLQHPSGRLLARSVKLYADGALGSRGAALLDDYSDEPGSRGLLFVSDQEMQSAISKALSCNLQVGVHAIGDGGNRQVLDAYAAGLPAFPDNPGRHRIEHAQVIALDDIPRFASMGIIASVQPIHATSDMYWAEERVGPQRIQGAYAWRHLLNAGVRLALGSDFPVEQVNPMLGIYAAVTRQDLQGRPPGGWYPAEVLGREEALRGFTLDAAWAAFMENEVGSIEAGKRADFIVLDRDLMTVDAADIPATQVLETWLDGKLAWKKPD